MLSMINSVYATIRHTDGKSFLLGNLSGTLVSKETANHIVDKIVEGDNKTVMSWKSAVESMWRKSPHSHSRRRKLAENAPGYTLILDNVGKVTFENIKKIGG
jgi:hypothetical protein